MKEYKFKPFDQVLARDVDDEVWTANLFSHYVQNNNYKYHCVDNSYQQCIPYNEETAHLIGTTNEYKPEEPKEWEIRSSNGLFIEKFTSDRLKKFIEIAVINNKDVTDFKVTHVF